MVRSSEPLVARVVGVLFVLGALLGVVSLLLPHPAVSNDGAIVVVSAVAAVTGCACVTLSRLIPPALVHLTVAASSVLICTAIYLSGVASGLYSTMFVWVALFSAYFFPRRSALLHLGWLLACYAVVLVLVEDAAGFSPLTRWLLTAIALAVTSTLTSWLVSRRRAAEERSQRFFELSHDMLCTVDADGYLVELNPAWEDTLGHSRGELRSRPLLELVHPDDRTRAMAEAARAFQGEEARAFETRCRAKDGTWRWLLWSAAFSPQQGVVYARATDVTDRKLLETERQELLEELEAAARTDPLTGVPNRRWLADELDRELARAGRQGLDLCAAMVDLDHFKRFNDRHGHPAGDALLRDACSKWMAVLRAGDFLARYGGEEFIVLLPDCSLDQAQEAIERLRAATPAGQTCSAGVASWDGHESAEALIARADAALYAAKTGGRDRTTVVGGDGELASAA